MEGARQIEGFVGSDEAKYIWVEEEVKTWVAGVKRLVVFVRALHQTAYYDLAMLLQSEWQFFKCVTPSVAPLFAPRKEALKDNFIPDLLGGRI